LDIFVRYFLCEVGKSKEPIVVQFARLFVGWIDFDKLKRTALDGLQIALLSG